MCTNYYMEFFVDSKDLVDSRDVKRFMSDDDYADLFLEWSRSEEEAVKLVLKCFKWRHERKVNGMLETLVPITATYCKRKTKNKLVITFI